MIDLKVRKYSESLKELGIEHEILEHPELKEVRGVMDYLKLPIKLSLATLIMKADDEFVAVIKKGDAKIDSDKIRKALNVDSLRLANKEEYQIITEAPLGAAFVYNPGLKTLIDARVAENEYMIGGSGSLECSIRYRTSDLKKIPRSQSINMEELNDESKVKRVFSGSRPTGRLHLGNYLGGVKGYIALQNKGDFDCIYSVVDLHGITTPYAPDKLQTRIQDVVLDYLACGLDPKKCHLMIQSQVPEHVELAYLLGTIYPVSRMEQLPTYKTKKMENPDYVNVGLFYYPILMAADILIYKASLVPVGIDQEPHLEITREVARKFNQMFGSIFPEPQRFATPGQYVPSLTGSGKMSKSIEGSYINLTDDLETIKKKLATAPTDSGKGEKLPTEGGVANLLTLVKLFEGDEVYKEDESKYLGQGIRYSELKEGLAQSIYNELKPIQERRKYFEEHVSEVTDILEEGRVYCKHIAQETIIEVKQKMGII